MNCFHFPRTAAAAAAGSVVKFLSSAGKHSHSANYYEEQPSYCSGTWHLAVTMPGSPTVQNVAEDVGPNTSNNDVSHPRFAYNFALNVDKI